MWLPVSLTLLVKGYMVLGVFKPAIFKSSQVKSSHGLRNFSQVKPQVKSLPQNFVQVKPQVKSRAQKICSSQASSQVMCSQIWSSQASSQVTSSHIWSSQATSQVMGSQIWSSQVKSGQNLDQYKTPCVFLIPPPLNLAKSQA